MTERDSETFHGVDLTQYATVVAGSADGFPLLEILAFAAVPSNAWARAERAWGARLLANLEADGQLAEELALQIVHARRRWERPLPPLDVDLRAWLDFERTWAAEVDGDAFLERMRLRSADISRLQALWAERLEQDAALTEQALSFLTAEPRPPCTPAPEPARFPARTGAPEPRLSPSLDLTRSLR